MRGEKEVLLMPCSFWRDTFHGSASLIELVNSFGDLDWVGTARKGDNVNDLMGHNALGCMQRRRHCKGELPIDVVRKRFVSVAVRVNDHNGAKNRNKTWSVVKLSKNRKTMKHKRNSGCHRFSLVAPAFPNATCASPSDKDRTICCKLPRDA
jgi:hypothetical protein